MKTSILYSLLFATAMTILATADYNNAKVVSNNIDDITAMNTVSATQESPMIPVGYFIADSALTVTR